MATHLRCDPPSAPRMSRSVFSSRKTSSRIGSPEATGPSPGAAPPQDVPGGLFANGSNHGPEPVPIFQLDIGTLMQ